MEYNKALETMKMLTLCGICTTGNCKECDRYNAKQCAISAMEKQIPKKPVKDKYEHSCCPNCGWIVYKDEWGGRYLPHCENCGQAIDWSDTNG